MVSCCKRPARNTRPTRPDKKLVSTANCVGWVTILILHSPIDQYRRQMHAVPILSLWNFPTDSQETLSGQIFHSNSKAEAYINWYNIVRIHKLIEICTNRKGYMFKQRRAHLAVGSKNRGYRTARNVYVHPGPLLRLAKPCTSESKGEVERKMPLANGSTKLQYITQHYTRAIMIGQIAFLFRDKKVLLIRN